MNKLVKNKQYYKFCAYGFLKNLRFFDAFFILFLLEKELSFTQIGFLYAIREIVINIVEIPSGIFADTYGKKTSLLGSFVLYIFSFVVFYFAANFGVFLIAFVLYGIADAFRSGTHKTMIMDYLKLNNWDTQKINYYGHTRSCSQKGSAISALVAGLIVFYYGDYQMIFLFSIVPYILNLVLVYSYPKELDRTNYHSDKKSRPTIRETFISFYKIIKRPKVLRIVHSSAVHSAFQKAIKDYIQPLMLSVAFLIPVLAQVDVQKKNGLIIGIIYFGLYILTSQASRMAAGFDQKTKQNSSYVTLIYGFLFGLISGVFYQFDLWVFSLVAFMGIYLVENIRKPILTGVLADHVPNEILTSIISAQSLWKTILTAVIAILLGFLADHFGIGIAFVVVSMILLLSAKMTNGSFKKKSK